MLHFPTHTIYIHYETSIVFARTEFWKGGFASPPFLWSLNNLVHHFLFKWLLAQTPHDLLLHIRSYLLLYIFISPFVLLRTYSLYLFPDPRVNDWAMMSSPFPTVAICLSYAYFSRVLGPKLMENRKPFDLRGILIMYNLIQTLFSSWIFYEVRFFFFLHIFISFNFIDAFLIKKFHALLYY